MSVYLYYFHDPMCSWCYAFQPGLIRFQKNLPTSIQLIKIVGGLAADTMEPMSADLQINIQQTWHRIEQTVPGIKFNFDFWTNNTPFRSTYPACRSILAAKKQGAVFEDRMINSIQKAYYQYAKNPSLTETLMECAGEIGLDMKQYKMDYFSKLIEKELQKEIQFTRSLNVSSFPSLRIDINGKIITINIDYSDSHKMTSHLLSLLEE